jgi:hypothetical protein
MRLLDLPPCHFLSEIPFELLGNLIAQLASLKSDAPTRAAEEGGQPEICEMNQSAEAVKFVFMQGETLIEGPESCARP